MISCQGHRHQHNWMRKEDTADTSKLKAQIQRRRLQIDDAVEWMRGLRMATPSYNRKAIAYARMVCMFAAQDVCSRQLPTILRLAYATHLMIDRRGMGYGRRRLTEMIGRL